MPEYGYYRPSGVGSSSLEVGVREADDTEELASLRRRHRELARQLADIGFIASSSVALRYNRCGKAYCACHADPARLHGPYWQFTAKVAGKTVNKRLSEDDARLYKQWIANDRQARALLAEMREVAGEAAALMLGTDNVTRSEPPEPAESASPETRRGRSRPRL